MSTDRTYNGWTNYETWCWNLWMDNQKGSQAVYHQLTLEAIEQAKPDRHFTKRERAELDLADLLKDEAEDAAPDLGASVWADLMGAAMSEINWKEIADHLIEGAWEETEEEEEGEKEQG